MLNVRPATKYRPALPLGPLELQFSMRIRLTYLNKFYDQNQSIIGCCQTFNYILLLRGQMNIIMKECSNFLNMLGFT